MATRILRFPLSEWLEPEAVFLAAFADEPYIAWLDSGADAETGVSVIATATEGSRFATASVADGTVSVGRPGKSPATGPGDILDALASSLAGFGDLEPRHPEATDFSLGWIGWLGYEYGASANGVPVSPTRVPDAAMLFVERAVVFDHATRTIELIALDEEGAAGWADELRSRLTASVGPAAPPRMLLGDTAPGEVGLRWRHDDTDYLRLIGECQEAIRRGDAYQLCLTNEATADVSVDPIEAYLRLRASSPTHHGGLLRFGDVALLSSSPEQFLSITPGRRIRTKPIKGTRPRGATVSRDLELRAELEASEKERAENVMIVDLMRNDLGRVCVVGSVEVHHLLAVESYAQVHQLVSTVEGVLAEGVDPLAAVAACFPAGSMTGAPKISAMRILHRLENGPRGIYSGCFGYLGLDGSVDLAMVIRSIVVEPERVSLGAGGGITALSVPEEELDEVAVKASALIAALVR
ncbi:aminodeoxychorismate synthase component I [Diaminobutyricibacter tongyongensis]|uniref:aminodeoxychorismate synthase n=1 Tax=Leifsonia tongyongensis TaxID=1268043 RepID=A0A6L9XZP8_9MICO|nr:aminodeoxychorismate synthase component I [Diaminobutyricibacter tongyongensis]NEN06504.1 aminodeoxychorismate synthase component I [Diaminobutyricibacter tongyongensis]